MQRQIFIDSKKYILEGDTDYLGRMSDHFEPDMTAIFKNFCRKDSQVLDLGANLGLTTIALANICEKGKVIAVEPVPITFDFLKKNLLRSGLDNIKAYNFAVGNKEGTVLMQGNNSFLAGSFVADLYASEEHELSVNIPVKTLDKAFDSFQMDRVDFVKLDVEGYELFALEGAKEILNRFKPIVYLEMNHWCLNVLQRICLPEFRERLLTIFPYIYAIEGTSYLDFADKKNFHSIAHSHLIYFKYVNLIAGFDEDKILQNLTNLHYQITPA